MTQTNKRSVSIKYIFFSLLAIIAAFALGSFFHSFLHLELHPLDDNHIVVGSATALLSLLLVTTLFMRTRTLSKEVEQKEFDLKNIYEGNEIFRLLSEKSGDMVHLNDPDGTILYANPVTYDMLGYEKDEIINRPAEFLLHPDDREQIRDDMGRVSQGEDVPPREIRLLTKAGDFLDVEVKGFSLNTESDRKYIGAILRDITNRKRSKYLQQVKKEWERTFNSLNDYISVHDKDFKVVKANRALCDFLGISPDDIIGKPCYQIFHNLKEPFTNCPHKKTIETSVTVTEIIDDPHTGVPLEMSCSPFFDDSGHFQGSVHIARVHDKKTQTNTEGLVPICSACKKIRKADNKWIPVETFFMDKYDCNFTHTVCSKCSKILYPGYKFD